MSLMEEAELRRRKLEEALEVKSLRRIISAYLNYPEASEEDIKRYERYFRRLTPGHKELLSHLPHKYQKLRWCISENSYFIFEMLKAFEPPLDLSQNLDVSQAQSTGNVYDHCPLFQEMSIPPSESDSNNGKLKSEKADGFSWVMSNNGIHLPLKTETASEEKKIEFLEDKSGQCSTGAKGSRIIDSAGPNGVQSDKDNLSAYSMFHCDERVCSPAPAWLDPSLQYHVPLVDVDKVRCIIRNIVRDWAAEGQKERDECYKPILQELERIFPCRSKESPPACVVPGAGLGRLALEISSLGFICQGNEFSYYMMICSSFILNNSDVADEWTIYPWIHSNCNSLSDNDQLRPVSIPDIHPASAGITEGFSMCGGDFLEVYNDPNQQGMWDAVVTCFFIDTAHNVVEYIETISRILRGGGVWINLGPLLYHFADSYEEGEMSVELSLEDVKKVACSYGFKIEKESMIGTTYTTNPRSMMQNQYNAAFWTMRKPPPAKSEHAP